MVKKKISRLFLLWGFLNHIDINVDLGVVYLRTVGMGRAEVMSFRPYCSVSFPPHRQKNLLHRVQAPKNLPSTYSSSRTPLLEHLCGES